MFDLQAVQTAFPELTAVTVLSVNSGQKWVFSAKLNGEEVALKLIKPGPQEKDRTEREIAAVAKLTSDNVPKLRSHGRRAVAAQEMYFIIEQFIPGETYRKVLAGTPAQPLGEVMTLADVLLRACSDFQTARFVHRDIKPENLIRDKAGKTWVIDFGLARPLDTTSITPSGAYRGVGTIGYAAPEQFRNEKTELDCRADLFATGVVLYESLVGFNPYLRGATDVLTVLKRMESKDLPRLTIPGDNKGGLSDFLVALTSRFPSRRPQSTREAIEWFKAVKPKPTTE